MTDQPAKRLDNAAEVLERLSNDASPLPWTYYEDHGRDFTDEGWSHIGVLDAEGKHVAHTSGPGYEGNEQPEQDAALTAILSATTPHLSGAMRAASSRYERLSRSSPRDLMDPVDEALLAVADAILELTVKVPGE